MSNPHTIQDDCVPIPCSVAAMGNRPLDADALATAQRALVAAAQAVVGIIGLVEAQKAVRQAMLVDALERTCGNRHATARLLRVDRRYVTMMVNPSIASRREPRRTDPAIEIGEDAR